MPTPHHLRPTTLLAVLLALLAALLTAVPAATAPRPGAARTTSGHPDLGPNLIVLDPSMSRADIQARVDAVAAEQVPHQLGPRGHA
jgi:hypothetical protein